MVVLVLISLLAAGCSNGSSPNGGADTVRSIVVSNTTAAGAVTAAINGAGTSPGLAGAPRVRCLREGAAQSMSGRAGLNCFISYTVKKPAGINPDLELIQPTAGIWKALFSDPRFQAGYIEVRGPTTSVGGQSNISPEFSLACNRHAASQIDWNGVTGEGLRKLCVYVRLVGGLPG
jgi:hypothetical protein